MDPEGHWAATQAEVFEENGAGQPLGENNGEPHPLATKRDEVEQQILGDLLRMNQERAGGQQGTL